VSRDLLITNVPVHHFKFLDVCLCQEIYPVVGSKTIKILMPFSTTYLICAKYFVPTFLCGIITVTINYVLCIIICDLFAVIHEFSLIITLNAKLLCSNCLRSMFPFQNIPRGRPPYPLRCSTELETNKYWFRWTPCCSG
jgi:hypothetical protein